MDALPLPRLNSDSSSRPLSPPPSSCPLGPPSSPLAQISHAHHDTRSSRRYTDVTPFHADSLLDDVVSMDVDVHRDGMLSPPRTSRRKEKRPPTVTPRRWRRFFTRRASAITTASSRALQELQSRGNDRQSIKRDEADMGGADEDDKENTRKLKRRKISFEDIRSRNVHVPRRIDRFGSLGASSQRLLREIGSPDHHQLSADPRIVTAPFYSDEQDAYICHPYETSSPQPTIPFSLAPFRSSPLVAIGDEQGFVRFLDTSVDQSAKLPSHVDDSDDDAGDNDDDNDNDNGSGNQEARIRAHVKVHDNAIMGLSLSHDDLRLATACGDRTGAILDVPTQTTAVLLQAAHVDSMRQVTFQPGSAASDVLATSDRDGCIQVWDLRCSTAAQVDNWSAHQAEATEHTHNGYRFRDPLLQPILPRPIDTVDLAHSRTVEGVTTGASVTALTWFNLPGREHILLSASEANSSIRIWDTRFIRTQRRGAAVPVSVTAQPFHRWRTYGLTSLALSADSSRLYALCRDSTVYAYSAPHLMLGIVPEMTQHPPRPRRCMPNTADPAYTGLGPIYGFRHAQFRAQSFYVKCALRPRSRWGPEILAVGSSENAPILFPTEDRFIRAGLEERAWNAANTTSGGGSLSFGSTLCSPAIGSDGGGVPIVRNGTPLIRGHRREVTMMGWTMDGVGLVTASDDCAVRHWRGDDASRARELRTCGEFGGLRHMAGWADVEADWDEDDN